VDEAADIAKILKILADSAGHRIDSTHRTVLE
jgi:hypothetical protein